jgi:hypothetical protein
MPVLNSQSEQTSAERPFSAQVSRAFPICANPRCESGWLHLWRKRRAPVIEGGWLCSPDCTRTRVHELLRREYAEAHPPSTHRHRVPIGLILLTQGWITREQLRQALEAQRKGAGLRVGEWLVAHEGLSESRLAQALGMQWSCPVFSLEKHGSGRSVTIVPRLLAESFGFVPLQVASSRVLFLAFEDRIDHSLTLAVERMTGLPVESGLLSASEFRQAGRQLQQGRFPRARLIEAASLDLLAKAFTRHIEKARPTGARLVRLHDLFWLRLWQQSGDVCPGPAQSGEFEDIVGSVVRFA